MSADEFNAQITLDLGSLPTQSRVGVLVIREWLDRRCNLLVCVLERRLGSADGPYHGDPARIEFTGAVERLRFFQALTETRLRETAPRVDGVAEAPRREGQCVGEIQAVSDAYGHSARILSVRDPTTLEALAGFASILHVRSGDRVFGCGIIWHGTMPVIVEARFPRLREPPRLPARSHAVVDATLRAHRLVACLVRRDRRGAAIIAHRPGTRRFFCLRTGTAAGARIRMVRHMPRSGMRGLTSQQRRWVTYATRFERLAVIAAWREAAGEAAVIGIDPNGHVLRHQLDPEGLEKQRVVISGVAADGPAWRASMSEGLPLRRKRL